MAGSLVSLERWLRLCGGVLALVALISIFAGISRGMRRPAGMTSGSGAALLRSPWFYIIASLLFFGATILLWRPLPLTLTPLPHLMTLVLGSLLYFPALGLVLWGRLALGKMYFVSGGTLGTQLFADHQLVRHGPFALVRHPMYLGMSVAVLGGLLLYQTWTMVFLLLLPLGLSIRAWREEQALAIQFGEEWQEYCRRVPAFIPRLKQRMKPSGSKGEENDDH